MEKCRKTETVLDMRVEKIVEKIRFQEPKVEKIVHLMGHGEAVAT